MTSQPDRYAVFGNPISHSKSPLLQSAFAEQTEQHIIYTAECVDVGDFSNAADQFFNSGGKGLNITVPFKLDAFNYVTELSSRAKKAGAVNTLIKKDGKIIGDNTDGVGLVNDILNNLQWTLKNKKILILGAGGAVRGIIEPLLNTQPECIVIANRSVEKAYNLVDIFNQQNNISACRYDELAGNFDIVINGTSASLSGQLPALPDGIVNNHSCCYDMMYGKSDTVFMQWARENNVRAVADGLGMLVCQGAESFYQWREVMPKTDVVVEKIRALL